MGRGARQDPITAPEPPCQRHTSGCVTIGARAASSHLAACSTAANANESASQPSYLLQLAAIDAWSHRTSATNTVVCERRIHVPILLVVASAIAATTTATSLPTSAPSRYYPTIA